jgi:hypothetical protein
MTAYEQSCINLHRLLLLLFPQGGGDQYGYDEDAASAAAGNVELCHPLTVTVLCCFVSFACHDCRRLAGTSMVTMRMRKLASLLYTVTMNFYTNFGLLLCCAVVLPQAGGDHMVTMRMRKLPALLQTMMSSSTHQHSPCRAVLLCLFCLP